MKTLQAYRFALDPNDTQLAGLRRHAGASRFTYNWALARVKAALSQRAAEQTYGVTGDGLTPVPWALPALRLAWNAAKREIAPWWDECSKEAFSAGLDQLARALKNFTDSRRGKRKGRRVGFPRFKKRGKARDSFRYTTGAYGPADATYVKLPRIGRVRVHEPMDALTGRLADGRARLLGATVSRTAGRWFVSFTAEADRDVPAEPSRRARAGGTVGVDLGVKHLAVLSTGETVPNPKHYQRAERKLRRAARECPTARRGGMKRTIRRSHATVTPQDDALWILSVVGQRHRLARIQAHLEVRGQSPPDLDLPGVLPHRCEAHNDPPRVPLIACRDDLAAHPHTALHDRLGEELVRILAS